MQNKSDAQLLGEYAAQRSEPAFAEIVARHTDLVYSAAIRKTGSPDLAHEVAQMVFTDLARKAHSLPRDVLLTGWLYEAARFAGANAIRGERRRQVREQEALAMHDPAPESTPGWEQLCPVLDDAMGDLCAADRDAILLRYFKNQDFQTVGLALGVSGAAAQRRVSRAVERLREFFAQRGVTVGASGLIIVISANAVAAAPAGLNSIISSTALSEAGAQTTTTVGLTTAQKILIAAVVLAAVSFGTYEARQYVTKTKVSSAGNVLASQFAGLTESNLPGRYNWIEPGKATYSIVLYADHTFINKDGTIFPTYRWDIVQGVLVMRWAQTNSHFTSTDTAGVLKGINENGAIIRLEKQPLEPPRLAAAASTTPTDIIASIRLDAQSETNGLTPVNTGTGDGKIVSASVGGVACYQLVRKAGRPAAYLYLQIAPELKAMPFSNAWVTVEYFDAAKSDARSGWLLVQYDAPAEAYRTTQRLSLTGSQTWKEATFFVAGPLFQNRQNAGGDFRLCAVNPELFVRSVKLVKGNSLK
jgi:RNA polymerase sigma factor (sigma-70 family)